MTANLPLTRLARGQAGRVAEIHGGHGIASRLEGLGIRPGVCISLMSSFALGGPVTICVGRACVAVGRGMAKKILVEVEHGKPHATAAHR